MKPTPICPDGDSLVGMLDGELQQVQQDEITQHVNSCPTCQMRLEDLVTTGLREDLEFDHVGQHLREGQVTVDGAFSTDELGEFTATILNGLSESGRSISLDFLESSEDSGVLGRLGQYEVTEVIGRGGMGIALKARDTRLDRVVAIKVLAPELASNPTARRRFLREARAAAAVSHDHVVTIHAVEPDDLPYLVMEFVDGISLQQKIERNGPLEVQEILRIGMQTAYGLSAAHSQGLIHHDIKPANIMLQNGIERVQITDFGLARAVDDVTVTRTGEVRGTPQYMSPEQARGELTDQRSDLFSLGAVMYAMCTGRPPFRADSTMGVLHRVINDAPRPIREVNQDIPDWLVALIDRLLEKHPDDRFRTAAEIADALSQYLAHVQQPIVVPLPELAARPSHRSTTVVRRPKWYVGAILLAVVFGTLTLTEATGLTNLSSTVIRIVTGEGTLVVEVDDPSVEVSVDGEELSITGAGLREVKLRPGQYQFQATKDGKAVKQELVTITQGGKQVVRISQEPRATTSRISGAGLSDPSDPFVVLGGDGKEIAKFGTLADAVLGSSPGDTIEIRGNGPFVTDPLTINHPLRIRAGSGYRPAILDRTEVGDPFCSFITVKSAVVLEGLELRRASNEGLHLVEADAPLQAVNCQFHLLGNRSAGIAVYDAPLVVKNCEFSVRSVFIALHDGDVTPTALIENSLCAGHLQLSGFGNGDSAPVTLKKNTIVSPWDSLVHAIRTNPVSERGAPQYRMRTSGNIFDTNHRVLLYSVGSHHPPSGDKPVLEREFRKVIDWEDRRNVYRSGNWYLAINSEDDETLLPAAEDLTHWDAFWHQSAAETRTTEGTIRYARGDLLNKSLSMLDELRPDDFRLRPDSAGYRAGPDGEDLGANIDFVGPGVAYERWKQTDEYRQWLKESLDLIASTAAEESSPFVVLSSNRQQVTRFSSLTDAVLGSSAGDTIEIRGNGPFVTESIEVNHPLRIVAGNGFQPVICEDPQNPPTKDREALLWANAPLVLEGLELETTHRNTHKVVESLTRLSALNCRFLAHAGRFAIFLEGNGDSALQNCELIAECPLTCRWKSIGEVDVENCLLVGHINFDDLGELVEQSLSIQHSTVLNDLYCPLLLFTAYGTPNSQTPKTVHFRASGSVLDSAEPMMGFIQTQFVGPALSAEEAERWLQSRSTWQERQNMHATAAPYLGMMTYVDRTTASGAVQTITEMTAFAKDRAAWNRFWMLGETDSQEGVIRYQGGDLHAKVRMNLGGLTPEDFRLRPDSAGYRAGPEGKDLGANIDFVGPGAAYERWRQTPEYLDWQQETRKLAKTASNRQYEADHDADEKDNETSSGDIRQDEERIDSADEQQPDSASDS